MSEPPWYKQFWPWFLIALPMTVVCASIYTLMLASSTPFSLVSEDYYKKGKAINQDLSRIRLAQNIGMTFSMAVESDRLLIKQHGGPDPKGAIRVTLHHATLPNKDNSHLVTQDGYGNYRISLTEPLSGKWHADITSFDSTWKLQQKFTTPTQGDIWFK